MRTHEAYCTYTHTRSSGTALWQQCALKGSTRLLPFCAGPFTHPFTQAASFLCRATYASIHTGLPPYCARPLTHPFTHIRASFGDSRLYYFSVCQGQRSPHVLKSHTHTQTHTHMHAHTLMHTHTNAHTQHTHNTHICTHIHTCTQPTQHTGTHFPRTHALMHHTHTSSSSSVAASYMQHALLLQIVQGQQHLCHPSTEHGLLVRLLHAFKESNQT